MIVRKTTTGIRGWKLDPSLQNSKGVCLGNNKAQRRFWRVAAIKFVRGFLKIDIAGGVLIVEGDNLH